MRAKLPPRGPGMPDELALGEAPTTYRPYDPEKVLAEPEPRRPAVPEPLEAVRERIVRQVGRVTCPRDLSQPHPAVRRLLDADEKRREKHRANPWGDWYAPWFDSPFERRRLRILNGLFLGLARCGTKAEIGPQKGRPLTAYVGAQQVAFLLDHPAARKNRHGEWEVRAGREDELKLVIGGELEAPDAPYWSDSEHGKLESLLSEIVVAVIVQGEVLHRERTLGLFQWRLEQRERAAQDLRRRAEEAERVARERRAREEQQAREALLKQARNHREANEIRALVSATVDRLAAQEPADARAPAVADWSSWALSVADRLDPIQRLSLTGGTLSFGGDEDAG